jgi:hypothetical protein
MKNLNKQRRQESCGHCATRANVNECKNFTVQQSKCNKHHVLRLTFSKWMILTTWYVWLGARFCYTALPCRRSSSRCFIYIIEWFPQHSVAWPVRSRSLEVWQWFFCAWEFYGSIQRPLVKPISFTLVKAKHGHSGKHGASSSLALPPRAMHIVLALLANMLPPSHERSRKICPDKYEFWQNYDII